MYCRFVSSYLLSSNQTGSLRRVRFIINHHNNTVYYLPLTADKEPLEEVIINDIKNHPLAYDGINDGIDEYHFVRIGKMNFLNRIEQLLSLEVNPMTMLAYKACKHVRDVAYFIHFNGLYKES